MKNPIISINSIFGLLLGFLMLTLTIGCQPEADFKEVKILENDVWRYDQSLSFESEIRDTSATYEVGLMIQHLKSYPFQNLYFTFSHNVKGATQADTITLDLVNKDGYFKGECNTESCVLEKILLNEVRFENAGKQTFNLEQFTRNESLEGIREIGLFIRKVNPAK